MLNLSANHGIKNELARQPDLELVGEAADGDGTLQLVQSRHPHVLILDINMPGMPSVELLHQVAVLPAPPRVLVLTAYGDLDHILMMLKAGATGYLLKDEDPSMISTAVRTVARGEAWMSTAVMAVVVDHTVKDPPQPAEPPLSAREVEVLQQLAEGKDNREIGEALHISERTVRFHLRNIYDKLSVRRGEAIAWSVRQGLGGGKASGLPIGK